MSSAQVWLSPEATADIGGRLTWTGTVDCAVVPLPSWPEALAPQHSTAADGRREQVYAPPALTTGVAEAAAGVGARRPGSELITRMPGTKAIQGPRRRPHPRRDLTGVVLIGPPFPVPTEG